MLFTWRKSPWVKSLNVKLCSSSDPYNMIQWWKVCSLASDRHWFGSSLCLFPAVWPLIITVYQFHGVKIKWGAVCKVLSSAWRIIKLNRIGCIIPAIHAVTSAAMIIVIILLLFGFRMTELLVDSSSIVFPYGISVIVSSKILTALHPWQVVCFSVIRSQRPLPVQGPKKPKRRGKWWHLRVLRQKQLKTKARIPHPFLDIPEKAHFLGLSVAEVKGLISVFVH